MRQTQMAVGNGQHNGRFFMIHAHRSKTAFWELIQDRRGILISANYGVYFKWVEKRQSCPAHYIRKARALAECKCESAGYFLEQLQLLCSWPLRPPREKEWIEFYSGFICILSLFESADGDADRLARSLLREMDSPWVFLEEQGGKPTNNRAERTLRYGAMWRKRS